MPGKPKALTLLDELLASPYLTVPRAAKVLGVTPPTARAAVKALRDTGLLTELADSRWRRVYVARPILEAIES